MNNDVLGISLEYARRFDEYRVYYDIMCAMIDHKKIDMTLKLFGINKLFIYGASYMGIMLYRTIEHTQDVIALVDKKGVSIIEAPDIYVVNLKKFRTIYSGEAVVVTVMRYGEAVRSELSSFISPDKIYMLGEITGRLI